MGHVTNVGNVNVIDDNISQIGGVDGNDASVSGTTLTTLGAFTINSSGLSAGNVLIQAVIFPKINNQVGGGTNSGASGNSGVGSMSIKILRGTTVLQQESFSFSHRPDDEDASNAAVSPESMSIIATNLIDENVSAGSFTYTLQASGMILAEHFSFSAVNLMK